MDEETEGHIKVWNLPKVREWLNGQAKVRMQFGYRVHVLNLLWLV